MPQLDSNSDGELVPSEAVAFFESQGRRPDAQRPGAEGWGLIGGVGAGVAAVGLAGYLTYTGLKGSHDLLYPKKDDFVKPPSDYGIPFEKVSFKSHDGLNLVGWYVPATVPTKQAIMLFQGHGAKKDTVFMKYGMMLADRYNLFVYDSRYSGESEGKLVTMGYFESQDAVLAVSEVRRRGNTAIGMLGESMGAAVAIETAAVMPDIKAVWADCAFASMHDAIAPRVAARKYPLPHPVAESIIATVGLRSKAPVAQADPIKWVAKIAPRPLYLVHGQKDDETTPENSEKLFLKALEPKTIWRTADARHAESWKVYAEAYRERVRTFFRQSL